MAKLNVRNGVATLNTGAQVIAKLMPVSEITVSPEMEAVFSKDAKVVEKIRMSMRRDGFHREEPVVVAKDEDGEVLGVADGYTRLLVARELGIAEIPVVFKTFRSLDEAKKYTVARQLHRRNLSQAEIFELAAGLDVTEGRPGDGRAAERLAEELGVSASTIEHARIVDKRASEDVKEAVRNNRTTVNAAYQSVRRRQGRPADGSPDGDAGGRTEPAAAVTPDGTDSSAPAARECGRDDGAALAERYREGRRSGWERGFADGAQKTFERIIGMLKAGKTSDEIERAGEFSDFVRAAERLGAVYKEV